MVSILTGDVYFRDVFIQVCNLSTLIQKVYESLFLSVVLWCVLVAEVVCFLNSLKEGHPSMMSPLDGV